MQRRLEVEGTSSSAYEIIPPIPAESPPAETSTDPSNDLGGRLMKLPIELRKKIIFFLTPKERCHLRQANKAMLEFVDASMSDVQEIKVDSRDWPSCTCCIIMKTINPDSGAKKTHKHEAVPYSSLPFLLKWTGAQLKTLELNIYWWISENKNFDWRPLNRVFEALNGEKACPKLKNLSLHIGEYVWDNNEVILSELLKYASKRQLQVNAIDHSNPFLHSLTLTSERHPLRSNKSAVKSSHSSEKRRKDLQDLLDQCHGLRELDMDSLLVHKGLPIVALRYPTTLTHLKSDRLNEAPGTFQTIVGNCPNLQTINLDVAFLREEAEVHALASLSDLRELTLESDSKNEELVQMTGRCLAAFDEHPFGTHIAIPWPQLRSVTQNCRRDRTDEHSLHRLVLSGGNRCVTSLHLTRCTGWQGSAYSQSVQQLFNALSSEDICSNLMELKISSHELYDRIGDSILTMRYHQKRTTQQSSDAFVHMTYIPSLQVYDVLSNLLAYVTKRQSAARLGKPFLRSLSITNLTNYSFAGDSSYGSRSPAPGQLEQIYTTVQQILDQCQGLEVLYLGSLEDQRINPSKKKGKELMESVDLRFPSTLKKLNDARLD